MVPRATALPYRVAGSLALGPVVLSCEHAGRALPAGIRPSAAERRVLGSHWGWDPGAWTVARALCHALDGSLIGGRWSRLWIDLNRRHDDPTLIRSAIEGLALSWNQGLDALELERRLARCHAPFHAELERQLARRLLRGVRPLLLAVHSFTPTLGREARRFDLGVLYDRHRGPARDLTHALRAGGFSVRYNQPYSGRAGMMYAASRHGSHFGLTCLELEINQRLVAERGFASRLTRVLVPSLEAIASDG